MVLCERLDMLGGIEEVRTIHWHKLTIHWHCFSHICSVPKLQSCLGVGVDNLGPKKTVRAENLEENVG